jgi:hypothetical protein
LIAGEVVALKKDTRESRMVGIDTGIDVGDDSTAGDLKLGLSRRNADSLRRGLIGITVPNGGVVISEWS